MRQRHAWLLVVGVLALALFLWRATGTPSPGPGIPSASHREYPAIQAAAAISTSARAEGRSIYSLDEGEVVRHIPTPDAQARRELHRALGLKPPEADLISLTVIWDGKAHFGSKTISVDPLPRQLLHVLRGSLEFPLDRLDGLDVARNIALPGDWVLRADAEPAAVMAALVPIVQAAGYPEFRAVPEQRKVRAVYVRGRAHAPSEPIDLLPPYPGNPPMHTTTRALRHFGPALSRAIRRPVSLEAEPLDLKVSWRDNAGAYLDLNTPVTDAMVADVLQHASSALGVEISKPEIEQTTWRLELRQ